MVSTSSISKKALVLLLALIFNFTSFHTAFASTVGGWTLSNPVAQGASTLYSGLKNVLINGKNVAVTGSALITPAAVDVAKLLGKGVAGVALSFAVEQLLGSVEWVLDPANNQITYKVKNDCVTKNTCQYLYATAYTTNWVSTASQACNDISKLDSAIKIISNTETECNWTDSSGNPRVNPILRMLNPAYEQSEEQEKSISLDTVASKVISNAESETDQDKKVAAQEATTAAAADIVAEAETDNTKAKPIVNQLENTATYPSETTADTKTDTKTNADGTTTTTGTTDLPAACAWMPSVCEAMQVVITSPTKISDWWAGVRDSVQDFIGDDTGEDTKLDIDTNTNDSVNSNISFGGSCPASQSVSVNFGGINQTINFDYTYFCDLASFIKPVILVLSSFAAALIVAGVRDSET